MMKRNYLVSLVISLVIFVAAIGLSIRFKKDGFEMFTNASSEAALVTPKDQIFCTLFRKQFAVPPSRRMTTQTAKLKALPPASVSQREIDSLLRWFRTQMQEIHVNYTVDGYQIHNVYTDRADPARRMYVLDVTISQPQPVERKKLRLAVSYKNNESYHMIKAAQIA